MLLTAKLARAAASSKDYYGISQRVNKAQLLTPTAMYGHYQSLVVVLSATQQTLNSYNVTFLAPLGA